MLTLRGSISGTSAQWVDAGSSGIEVTATPAGGYHFVKWSDNVMNPSRNDLSASAPISVTDLFEDDIPPQGALNTLSDTTIAAPSVNLPFTAQDIDGSGVANMNLWVKVQGSSSLVLSGLSQWGESGTFNYTFTAGDGRYEFATQSYDAAGNVETAPLSSDVSILVNIEPNSDFTQTLSASGGIFIFPMTNAIDIQINISDASIGGTITVSRVEGDIAPSGYDSDKLIDERLDITSLGLGSGWTATLIWNFDPSNNTIGADIDTLYQFDEPGIYKNIFTITPSVSTITVSGITSFSQWYAGAFQYPSSVSDWNILK